MAEDNANLFSLILASFVHYVESLVQPNEQQSAVFSHGPFHGLLPFSHLYFFFPGVIKSGAPSESLAKSMKMIGPVNRNTLGEHLQAALHLM